MFDEVWSRGRFDVADEILSPDFVGRAVGMGEPFHGPAGAKEFIGRLRAAFSDITFTVQDVIADGDFVATRWTARGTNDGKFAGMEPTGHRVTMDGITIQRIRDARIVEGWTQADALGLLEQIIVSEPAGT